MVLGRPFPTQISDLAWVCETGVYLVLIYNIFFYSALVVLQMIHILG